LRIEGWLANRSGKAAKVGGARRDRTDDLLLAKQALSQLSYGPCSGKLKSWRPLKAAKVGLPSRSSQQPARLRLFRLRRGSLLSLRERRLVGLGRFELPTSRLSSARSNQLSYRPKVLPHEVIQRATRLPQPPNDRGHMSNAPTILAAWARPRRKRNEDGEVPQRTYST
jgi:hypothetical protein